MKTTNFFKRLKLLLLIVLLMTFHSEGYSQAGLNEKGQLDSDPHNVVDKNGAKGNGTARTAYGEVFVKSLVVVATLTSTTASSITASTAASGGDITIDGGGSITNRGVVWSTVSTPTTALATKTSDGTGTGIFTSSITGLSPSTTYYLRSYAINSAGTAYGNEVSFTTDVPGPPVGGNAICDNIHPTTVVEITGPSGRIWMDRNLGASRAATGISDYQAYGCLYQWGRGNDGHASVIWTSSASNGAGTLVNATTTATSTTNNPGNAIFILNSQDWRSPKNDNLWQGVNGINNPCPSGFRIPTISEIEADSPGSTTAANAVMKVAHSGSFIYNGGAPIIVFTGASGNGLWLSSTVDSGSVMIREFGTISSMRSYQTSRADGNSVRCIKN